MARIDRNVWHLKDNLDVLQNITGSTLCGVTKILAVMVNFTRNLRQKAGNNSRQRALATPRLANYPDYLPSWDIQTYIPQDNFFLRPPVTCCQGVHTNDRIANCLGILRTLKGH